MFTRNSLPATPEIKRFNIISPETFNKLDNLSILNHIIITIFSTKAFKTFIINKINYLISSIIRIMLAIYRLKF